MISLFSKREPPEQRFWKWFTANSSRFRDVSHEHEALLDEFHRALKKVHQGLTFEFGPIEEGRRELVISADGHRDLFPIVQSLIEAAPPLPDWKIIAFRQRHDINLELQMGDIRLGPDQVWFRLQPDGPKVGLSLYLAGLEDVHSQAAEMASFILLDSALGEYDVETKVGFIEFHSLPEHPEPEGLKPLSQLPDEFDALYLKIHSEHLN